MAMAATVVTLLLLLCSMEWVSLVEGRKVGGKTKVNAEKREIQELGQFSVHEYNRRNQWCGGEIEFVRVVKAEAQVVAGVKYFLRVVVVVKKTGGEREEEVYDAEVVVIPWKNKRNLLAFTPHVRLD